MKKRNQLVANSSSCSFICCLTGDVIFGWDWASPADNEINQCSKCHSVFSVEALRVYELNVWPDEEGYIKPKNCPVCKALKRLTESFEDTERGFA